MPHLAKHSHLGGFLLTPRDPYHGGSKDCQVGHDGGEAHERHALVHIPLNEEVDAGAGQKGEKCERGVSDETRRFDACIHMFFQKK